MQINGRWPAFIQHMADGKSTFGWAHLFLTYERNQLIDFTAPYDTDTYRFFVR